MKNKSGQTEAAWSARSQQSLLEEKRLEGERENVDKLMHFTKRKAQELEGDKARLLKVVKGGDGSRQFALARTLEELEDKRRLLAAYKEQRASIQKEIEKLQQPSPDQLAERRERQAYLAKLAGERLKKDEQVQGALQGLRHLLEERARLTAKMLEPANTIELARDGLDAERLDGLLVSLPAEVYSASERWADWCLGREKDAKTYVVTDDFLAIPETLASAGVYRFGDRVELSADQARDLLREDRPNRSADFPWRCLTPSIIPVEEFEAIAAEAKVKEESIEDEFAARDFARDAKRKEEYYQVARERRAREFMRCPHCRQETKRGRACEFCSRELPQTSLVIESRA